eukprot:TRINITY_DN915_c0_g1_i3.p1 TRINITY_DN915_c0_g1~~TRINITY_DN915_c0_g1_i3.p1  ORF type:complete len:662 (+),score=269.99 TRINITY_DN915_c0_g1_i3:30-2015(+)
MSDTSSSSSSSSSKNNYWTTDPNGEVQIRMMESGPGAAAPRTVIDVFRATVEQYGPENALHVKREGAWKSWSWNQYRDDVNSFARALVHFGVDERNVISILGFNAPEWFIADMGAIMAGCIATGIYTTNGPEACFYILNHSRTKVAVVENEGQLKKLLAVRSRLPELKAIVQYTGQVAEGLEGVYNWQQFLQFGNSVPLEQVEERAKRVHPGHCSTLVYTSGTTGNPKAVMISHDNIVWTASALLPVVTCGHEDHIISYLPLSHIAAQIVDMHATMQAGAQLWFAQPDALRGSLSTTLKEVRPTVFMGVPRVWEKIEEKMREVGRQSTGVKLSIATWAKEVGLQGSYAAQGKGDKPWFWWLANRLVFTKVREALGLDRCKFEATTAAPISRETLDYFLQLNLPLFEVYGMSESTGPITVNFPNHHRTGTVGPAIPGIKLNLDRPDGEGNGEITCWGRNVFMGYMYDDKSTSETIDAEGNLHSGDIGKLDGEFLSITGRIKELIITAGGENVPPVLIEDEIKRHLGTIISNVMVIGDRRKFMSCVFTLRAVPVNPPVEGEYPYTQALLPEVIEQFAAAGSEAKTVEEAVNDPKVHAVLQAGLDKANRNATSNAQQIRKFIILAEDFALENDLLTPTLKLKRRNVNQKFGQIIDDMYASAGNE